MKNKIIVLMGAPGVGKGTFSKLLRADRDFNYIETGAMLRELPRDSEIAQMMARGELVPDESLFALIADKITAKDADVLMDGFPRTTGQAQWLVKNYHDKYDIHILYLDVPEHVILARINKRLNEGSTRADDADPKIVRRRIDTFLNTTMPAVEWLRGADGIRFSDIDASGPLDENMAYITAALAE